MKTLALLLLFAAAVFAAPNLNKPIAELKLNNGRVLKNVEIISYASSAVMAKWEGGRGTLRYEDFPDEYQTALATERPKPSTYVAPSPVAKPAATTQAAKPTPAATPTAPIAPQARKISGDAFLGGGESNGVRVKFAGMRIALYPLDAALKVLDTFSPDLPAPLAETQTDSEGHFSFEAPKVPFILLAQAEHRAARGNRVMPFEWRIKSTDITGDTLMLTGQNAVQRTIGQIGVR